MSEEKSQEGQYDPSAMMVEFYDAWTKTWADAMSETFTSERFAESVGKQMETSLDAMAMVRRQVTELMEQYLEQVSLPSRKEILSLAERLTNMEMVLDDLDAKMDEVLNRLDEPRSDG
jgi:hypothetical protein